MSELFKVSYVNVETDGVMYYKTQNVNKSNNAVKNEQAAIEIQKAAEAKAQNIIKNAKIDAENIMRQSLEEAQASIADAKKAGYDAGYETGYNEGFEKACSDVQTQNEKVLNEIMAIMDRLDEEKDRLFAENKKDIIELSFKIAEKVINQKLTTDEQSFLKIFENAAKDLTAQKWVKISVSNQQVEFVTKNSDYLLSVIGGAERLEVEVLDNAPAGECIIETSDKIVDASVSTQIDLLRAAVQTA